MELAPDGRIFVCQKDGQLRVIKNESLLSAPFLTVMTDSGSEKGLLGIAIDPDFLNNNFLYVYYTAKTPAAHNRVSRFQADGDAVVPGSETPILDLDDLTAGHHDGGAIHFGPDGKLYVATGENGTATNAQSLDLRLGKMLRINSDGSIPESNPFYLTANGLNRAIWALGLRNPFTFAFQPGSGRMFINDVGEDAWEEINEGQAGANFGWPWCEGRCAPFDPRFRDPIFQYGHALSEVSGCSIVGGAFYNPAISQFSSSYTGSYFFADYCGGWIKRLDATNRNAALPFASGIPNPVDLKVSATGLLYYLERGNGAVWRIQRADAPPALGVSSRGTELVFFWTSSAADYVLESVTNLSPGAVWTSVTNAMVPTNGQNSVTVKPSGPARFYRLSK
jgi:glucose/arabinose dehydrogenase